MSVQTLYTAATGMESLQTKLDVIANNLANVNTTGFKRGRANFEDLFYRHRTFPGSETDGSKTSTGTSIGLGSRIQSVQTDFTQGAFRQTNNPLNVLIEGQGFIPIVDPSSGETLYTRAGNLGINAEGDMVIASAGIGRRLLAGIQFPPDATDLTISANGTVSYRQPGQEELQNGGQIQLSMFRNPEGLLKLGENLYAVTPASGSADNKEPGKDGAGTLRQNMLEASNVEPVQELIDLITTQRSFELNSQAVKAGDEILQLISNLRRV